jgi:hypothetical protein
VIRLALEMLLAGAVIAPLVRVALIVRQPPGARLPDPSEVAGMPMAGPASQKAAHAAITRKKKV